MEKISLSYKEGNSDKVYQAGLERRGDGYVVQFAFGRRGSTLSTGYKTTHPVKLEEARVVLDRLLRQKVAKGYTHDEDIPSYQAQDTQERRTGIHCQLLNPAEESDLAKLLSDPEYWMQEKMDGRRLLFQKLNGAVTGINRLGLSVGLPILLTDAAQRLAGDFVIDGEAIGEVLHVFDLLKFDGHDLRGLPYSERHLHLIGLLESGEQGQIRMVETAEYSYHKKMLFEECLKGQREGVVFKRHDAPYTRGRPSLGGTQLKFKFCETASLVVDRVNQKRSVRLTVLDGGKSIPVGNVTIPPNHEVPPVGAVVDSRYLYAFPGGSIFQPVYLGEREDIRAEECVISQLKYKAA